MIKKAFILLLTLSSCQPEIVPPEAPNEVKGDNYTQFCPRCGWDSTLTFYTINPNQVLKDHHKKRSK